MSHAFAERLRRDAAHARSARPAPECSPLLLSPDEADALADVLEADHCHHDECPGDLCLLCDALDRLNAPPLK